MHPIFFNPTYPVLDFSCLLSAVIYQSAFLGVRQNQLTLSPKTMSLRYSTKELIPTSLSTQSSRIKLKHFCLEVAVLHLGGTAMLSFY